MKSFLFVITNVFVVSSIATGCGAKKKDEQKKSANAATAELSGTWISPCSNYDDGSSKSSVIFANGASTSTVTYYSAIDCKDESSVEVYSLSYVIGKALDSPVGAKEITNSPIKITITPKNDSGVSSSQENWGKNCGGVTFVKNKATEVTAATCKGDSSFGQSYNIYKVDGARLFFGECGEDGTATDCTAAGKRPKELDLEDFLTRI